MRLSGYRVHTASDGEEGVRVFRERCREIDIVLMDVIMPKKGGFEAYREIKAISATVPSIFVTGYNTVHSGNGEENEDGAIVIQKPYSIELLTRKIREILDQRRDSAEEKVQIDPGYLQNGPSGINCDIKEDMAI